MQVLQPVDNQCQQQKQSTFQYGGGSSDNVYRKKSAVVQPMPAYSEPQEKENTTPFCTPLEPYASGGITHNVTSMLSGSTPSTKRNLSEDFGPFSPFGPAGDPLHISRTPNNYMCTPYTGRTLSEDFGPFSPFCNTPYYSSIIPLTPNTTNDSAIDVGNASHDLLNLDTPAKHGAPDNASISPNPSNEQPKSPAAASTKSTSPESGVGSIASPVQESGIGSIANPVQESGIGSIAINPVQESGVGSIASPVQKSGIGSIASPVQKPPKKRTRTNYTPEQLRTLENVFFNQKYPDAEMMEKLSVDVDIEESKLKIWFQNKRARCKRGKNTNVNTANNANKSNPFMPMTPVQTPGTLGPFAQHSNMMGSTPQGLMSPLSQNLGGYLNYPGMPSPINQTNDQMAYGRGNKQSASNMSQNQSRQFLGLPTPYPPITSSINQTNDQMAYGRGNKQYISNMPHNQSPQFPGLSTPYPPIPAMSSASNSYCSSSRMSYSPSQMQHQQPWNFQFPSLPYP